MKFSRYFFILFLTCISLLSFSCSKEKDTKPIHYSGSYNRDFNDMNDLQLASALKIGISPVANREEAEKMKQKLIEVKSNDTYEIEDLKHSIPFLVPQAADLLKLIGANFEDSLSNLKAPHYKLIVTSITRTRDDVKNLRTRNGNSSENSTHMYGTTVDISWKRFLKDDRSCTEIPPEQLKMVLASVLRDLRKKDFCYIKHEKKQACFHITAR